MGIRAIKSFQKHGIEFIRVEGGCLLMGLSEAEEQEARLLVDQPRIWWESMQPVRAVEVATFTISVAPISRLQAARLDPSLPKPTANDASLPYRATWEDAHQLAMRIGSRLPTEAEWEYACRGGTTGLFAFGPLPQDDELEKWMSWDCSRGPKNGFGLRTIFTGEWCADTWSMPNEPSDGDDSAAQVIRGGGAYFWPWQDEEWIWCMSASRSPSTEMPDHNWSFRVVLSEQLTHGAFISDKE